MADGHNEGGAGAADWQGPYDPYVMQDDFDDVMHLLDIPGAGVVLDQPPLAVAAAHQAAAQGVTGGGSSGDHNNLLEWPAMFDNNSGDGGAPTHSAAAVTADRPGSSAHGIGSASTSAAASAHQNALDCTGCHVLREVLHSNGFLATKHSIHGAVGVFYHTTLEVYRINSEGVATDLTHQSYVDFRGRDYEWVKHYLTDYAQQRAGGGYTLVHDSISAFHDVLCTSMNYGGTAADDNHRREGMMETVAAAVVENGGGDQPPQELTGSAADGAPAQPIIEQADVVQLSSAAGPSEASANKEREVRPVGRSALAIQRERAKDLQLGDIARHFHLRMSEAAKQLGVCATVLKTASRRFRVPRWPYRKIKSIDNRIAKLRRSGGDGGGTSAAREIEKLIECRRKIYADLLGR